MGPGQRWAFGMDGPPMCPRDEWALGMDGPWAGMALLGPSGSMDPGQGCALGIDGT